MKRLILALFLVFMHAGPVEAGWDEAEAAYERGDYLLRAKWIPRSW